MPVATSHKTMGITFCNPTREGATIRTESNTCVKMVPLARRVFECVLELSRCGIPQANGIVLTAAGEGITIGTEGDAIDLILVSFKDL